MDCTGTRKDCFYIRLLISEENIMQENDIVQLRSGGPKMTIVRVFEGPS